MCTMQCCDTPCAFLFHSHSTCAHVMSGSHCSLRCTRSVLRGSQSSK
uniref:Uncharacterized protein n=1 Tax=Anguilla anguilla TaxID=7936 RepID=A0A0E9TI01_ANGAN